MGSSDFTFPPPLLDHNQSLVSVCVCVCVCIFMFLWMEDTMQIVFSKFGFQARVAFHFADPCYGGLAAAYGPRFQAYSIMPSNSDQIHHGTAPVRIPLPTDLTEEPIYVNSKQYHAIMRRRVCRAKLEAHNRLIKAPKVSVRLRLRFLSGRNMQDYTADKGGGVNHRRLSVLM